MGQAYVDITSHVFWESACKSSLVLVVFGLRRGDFLRLAGERGGVIRGLSVLGNVGEVFGGPKVGRRFDLFG